MAITTVVLPYNCDQLVKPVFLCQLPDFESRNYFDDPDICDVIPDVIRKNIPILKLSTGASPGGLPASIFFKNTYDLITYLLSILFLYDCSTVYCK